MNVIEEYAVWLVETGIDDSATDDLNEGGDPISERGETVSEEEWAAAMDLAHEVAEWVRSNSETLLGMVAAWKAEME